MSSLFWDAFHIPYSTSCCQPGGSTEAHLDTEGELVGPVASITEGDDLDVRDGLERLPGVDVLYDELRVSCRMSEQLTQ